MTDLHIVTPGRDDEDPPTWDAYHAASRAVEKHRARADAAEEQLRKALTLIGDLVDADDCWFDHHGGCQAHGYLSLGEGEKCPQQEAKELLAAHKVTP